MVVLKVSQVVWISIIMAVVNNNGSISLKIQVNNRAIWVNGLGSYSDTKRVEFVKQVDAQIKQDRRAGRFSFTTAAEIKLYYFPTQEDQRALVTKMLAQERSQHITNAKQLIQEYQQAGLGNTKITIVQRIIPKHSPLDTTDWLERLKGKYSVYTYNLVLSTLKRAVQWAISLNLCAKNTPILSAKPKRKDYRHVLNEQKRQPFSLEEVRLILQAFRTDQFCSPYSAYKHSLYADFVEAMFLMGTRPSELIGLRVEDCDFTKGIVCINTVLARDQFSNRRRRIRKPCKAYETKYLKMNAQLRSLLERQTKDKQPSDLVFTAPKGGPIDDRTFTRRIWRKILEGLGIPYRVFYACRHTFISHGIEQGIPVTDLAKLVGHSTPTTINKHYAKSLKNLPDLPVITQQ